MSVRTFVQPDYLAQTVAVYPDNVDAATAVYLRVAGAFAPHAQSSPNMTLRLDAGAIFNGSVLTEVAAQSTSTITAPSVNPRNDIAYVDRLSGAVGVAAGAESASPVDPAIPAGKVPVARIRLATSTTTIINSIVDDLRTTWSGLNDAGLVPLAKATASNSATIDFTSGIDDTYDAYFLTFAHVEPATDGVDFNLRISTNGGSSYDSGTNYRYHTSALLDTSAAYAANVAGPVGSTELLLLKTMGIDHDGSGFLYFYPRGSMYKQFVGQGEYVQRTGPSHYNATVSTIGGRNVLTTAVNAIRLFMSSGNILSGEFALYGVRKPS